MGSAVSLGAKLEGAPVATANRRGTEDVLTPTPSKLLESECCDHHLLLLTQESNMRPQPTPSGVG